MFDYILDVISKVVASSDWPIALRRVNASPLDISTLFSSYDDAVLYASGDGDSRDLGKTSYIGQQISVYDADENTVEVYVIDADRSLKPLNGGTTISITADEATIEDASGTIRLKNFGQGYYAAADGAWTEGFKAGLEPKVREVSTGVYELAWYEPKKSADAVADEVAEATEAINTIEETLNGEDGLVSKVEDIVTSIGAPASGEGDVPATGIYAEIDKKADASNVYTKGEADNKINEAVAAAAHLKRKTFENQGAAETFIQDNPTTADQYVFLIATGEESGNLYDEYIVVEGKLEPVGKWEVNLDNYVTNDSLSTTLNSYATTESVDNKLASYATTESMNTALGDYATTEAMNTALGNYATTAAMNSALEGYVAKEDGKGLVPTADIEKLAGITAGAEPNYIKSVEAEDFTVSPEGKLSLNELEIGDITGLQTALDNKVNVQMFDDGTGGQVAGTLLSPTDKEKLDALVISEEGGVEISGKVNAANVEGLGDWLTGQRESVPGLMSAADESKLDGITAGAEPNFVKSVDETELSVDVAGKLSLVNAPIITSVSSDFTITEGKQLTLTNQYVTVAQVGNLEDLIHGSGNPSGTIVDELNALNQRLVWQEMSE